MSLQEVVPGVHQLTVRMGFLPYVHAFLVQDDDGLSLVDCGLPKRAELFLASIAELGRARADLRRIVVTHHHLDHVGSLRAVAAATGAIVHGPRGDAAIIRGEATGPGANRSTWAGRWLGPVLERMEPRYEPPGHLEEVGDGDELPVGGGMRAIATPGHTAGHLSYLLPAARLLIAGDAGTSLRGAVRRPIGMFNEDLPQVDRTIAKLAELDFDVACFGHGGPIRGGANAAFRRAAEGFASKR